MALVASVKLPFDPRTRWFDPKDFEIHAGDALIVRTARGIEYGEAVGELNEVDQESINALKTPLQPVLRLATEEDEERRREMERLSEEALPVFRRLAAETNENMHPVMVQYLFDGNKAVFLFEAEERTDFRELVRRLSGELHIHVDMRQIGVRDEARLIGGLGHCGQELCCARIGGEICPVSIKMAKAQDLSLNPQQISGICGRLMCCLRYEYDAYKDFKSRAPKNNATISTPEGDFKVCQLDMPHEVVVLRTSEGKRVRIPLDAFDAPEEGAESQRPRSIGDVYYEYANQQDIANSAVSLIGSTERFTGTDKLAEKGAIHRNPQRKAADEGHSDRSSSDEHKRRRRRRSHHSQGEQASGNRGEAARRKSGGRSKQESASRSGAGSQSEGRNGTAHRRSRNRNHNVSENKQGTAIAKTAQGSKDLAKTDRSKRAIAKSDRSSQPSAKSGQKQGGSKQASRGGSANRNAGNRSNRPRRGNGAQQGRDASAERPVSKDQRVSGSSAGSEGQTGQAHRKARRRSHKTGGASDEA